MNENYTKQICFSILQNLKDHTIQPRSLPNFIFRTNQMYLVAILVATLVAPLPGWSPLLIVWARNAAAGPCSESPACESPANRLRMRTGTASTCPAVQSALPDKVELSFDDVFD